MIIQTAKQMRPRDPTDFYPTPIELCRAALATLPADIRAPGSRYNPYIIDPGAGTGVWGEVARERWPDSEISGCDIRDLPQPAAYDQWIPKWDFVHQAVGGNADLIMGNPPYKFAEEFVRKALQFAAPGGYVVFLLRLAFLEGQGRGRGLWADHPPQSVYVCSARPSFTDDGKTDATAYAIYVWSKGWTGQTALRWLDWKPADNGQLSLF